MDATEAIDAAKTVCDRLQEMFEADPGRDAEIGKELLFDARPLLHYLERTNPHYGELTVRRMFLASDVPPEMGFDKGVWMVVVIFLIEDLRQFIRDETKAARKTPGGRKRGPKPKRMTADEKRIKEMREQGIRPQEIDNVLHLEQGTAKRVLHRLRQRKNARAR